MPYFDMSNKKCTGCPPQQTIDLTTRNCGFPKMNSNYIDGFNYRLDPLT